MSVGPSGMEAWFPLDKVSSSSPLNEKIGAGRALPS